MTTTTNIFHRTALEAHSNGVCVVPSKMDGSKMPFGPWKRYQGELPTSTQIDDWFGSGLQTGLFTICGQVSGNLEMFEAETPELFDAYVLAAHEAGLGDLLDPVTNGYLSASPGGSRHILWRCDEIAGNTKLARRPKRPEEMRHTEDKIQVLFETRGQGGGTVEPPSNGRVHPSGGRYEQLRGGFSTIATITSEARRDFLNLARTFDQIAPTAVSGARTVRTGDSTRPGDDFDARTDMLELVKDHGWDHVFSRDGVHFIRRPGKDRGVSATINHDGKNRLWMFTSSTNFEANRSYTPFGAYAVFEHGGDFTEAAKGLRALGFGPQLQKDSAATGEASSPEQRPNICATDYHLERASARVWDAIRAANEPKRLFRYGGLASRIVSTDKGGPVAQHLDENRMSHEAARAALFYKDTEKQGRIHAAPPIRVLKDMLAYPDIPLPVLDTIVESPVFAQDGSLSVMPGYHAAGRTYYAPAPGFSVPEIPLDPSQTAIRSAVTLLTDDLMGDFPFVGNAERAHALAMLLLPFVRGLIDGPTPLHLFEKPTQGTGATLLIDAITRVMTGRPIGAMSEGRDEDEWRKRLTAKFRDSPSIVLIDNLRRRLDSAVVSSALTAYFIEDRILGTSDNIRIPIRAVWCATGNNPALSSEITRRTVRIRIDSKQDKPWLRKPEDFRHYPLLPWVISHRPQLVAACLTLGRAWIVAGQPSPVGAPVLGMFEDWSRTMAGLLDIAGVPGFLTNLDQFYESSDAEGTGVRAFLMAWWDAHQEKAVGVAELFPIATSDNSSIDLGDKGERSQKIRLGKMLVDLRDRHYQLDAGVTVRFSAAGTEKRAQLWKLIPLVNVVNDENVSHSAHAKKSSSGNDSSKCDTGGKHAPHSPHSPPWHQQRECLDCGAPLNDDDPGFSCAAHGGQGAASEQDDPWIN